MPWDTAADIVSRLANALLILMIGGTVVGLLAARVGRALARVKQAERQELRDVVERYNRSE